MERHHAVKIEDAGEAEQHWLETIKYNDAYCKWKPNFFNMMKKHEFIWDGHLGKTNVAKRRTVLDSDGAPPKHSALYRADHNQREPECDKVAQMEKAGVVEPAVAEWASLIVFVPKKGKSLWSFAEYRRLSAVTERDGYPIPRINESTDS